MIFFWTPARSGALDEFDTDLRLVCDLVELDSAKRISLREQWATGLRLMAERYPRKFAELVDGTGDATTGDILIQLAAFGELRRGCAGFESEPRRPPLLRLPAREVLRGPLLAFGADHPFGD